MRIIVFITLLMLSLPGWAGTATNPADYTVDVHVSTSRMVLEGNSIAHHQNLTAVIEGKKYELESIDAPNRLLLLGDYKAKVLRDERTKAKYDSWQVYEFIFSDNKTRQFLVVGQTE
jgi:hypothetical protein